jgi:hypothetical protein
LTDGINEILAPEGIEVGTIARFPGRQDLFVLVNAQMSEARLRPGQRSKDKLLGFNDWISVNNAVNDILDQHKFYAVVKSTKFIVRVGKRRRDNYDGGRSF